MISIMKKYLISQLEKDGVSDYLYYVNPAFMNEVLYRTKEEHLKYLKYIEYNRILKEQYHKTISDLAEFCISSNIKIIGLKGYFIEKQYYHNCDREYGDVDIWISQCDYIKIVEYFRVKNYVFYLNKKISDSRALKININRVNHLTCKKIFNYSNNVNIEAIIEIHGNLNFFNISNLDQEAMWEESSLINYGNFRFYTLSKEDTFVYLCYHITKHIPLFNNFIIDSFYIGPDKIVDIMLLLKSEKLNWEKIFKKICLSNIELNILYVTKIVDEIIKNLIPSDFITKLHLYAKNKQYKYYNIILKILELSAIDILMGNYKNLPYLKNIAKSINRKCNFDNLSSKAFYTLKWNFQLSKQVSVCRTLNISGAVDDNPFKS